MIAGGGWERWREGRPWATNAVLCVLGLALLLLTRQFEAEYDHFTIGFSGCSGWSVVVYLAAMLVVFTQPVNRWTFGVIVGFAVACRMVTLCADPNSSSDIYRYVWDGIVQHAGVSPYRYVPGDPALSFLREPNQEIFDNINRRDYAPTIYPPVAQMIYWLATFFATNVIAMKLTMFAFECLTAVGLVAMLKRLGRARTDLLVYAWCPLLVWEFGGAGHVDAAICAFLTLAVLFRLREQPVLVGVFLGLAIMTKFYPFVLLPALYKRGDWKMPAALTAVIIAGYAMYASVGLKVFGFLNGYQKEEGIDTGTRFFLLEWVQAQALGRWVTVHVYLLFCAVVLGAIALWAWRHASIESFTGGVAAAKGLHFLRPPAFVRAAAMLGLAMMLLFSPHYPWYVAWLVPLFALAPSFPLLAYVCAVFYGFTTQWADPGPKFFFLNKGLYGTVLLAIVLHLLLRWWRAQRGLTSSRDQSPASRPNSSVIAENAQ